MATISKSSPDPSKSDSKELTGNTELLTSGEKVLAGDAKDFHGLEETQLTAPTVEELLIKIYGVVPKYQKTKEDRRIERRAIFSLSMLAITIVLLIYFFCKRRAAIATPNASKEIKTLNVRLETILKSFPLKVTLLVNPSTGLTYPISTKCVYIPNALAKLESGSFPVLATDCPTSTMKCAAKAVGSLAIIQRINLFDGVCRHTLENEVSPG